MNDDLWPFLTLIKSCPLGGFLLLDGETFDVVGKWQNDDSSVPFGYDYWYQPRHNVMISSEWGAPKAFMKGFDLEDFKAGEINWMNWWLNEWMEQRMNERRNDEMN